MSSIVALPLPTGVLLRIEPLDKKQPLRILTIFKLWRSLFVIKKSQE